MIEDIAGIEREALGLRHQPCDGIKGTQACHACGDNLGFNR